MNKEFWKHYFKDWPYLIYKSVFAVAWFWFLLLITHKISIFGISCYVISDPFCYYWLIYKKKVQNDTK